MNFQLTEEQELIRRNAREFAETKVAPLAAEIDENGYHPTALFKELGAGGWLGIPLPERYGGAGADLLMARPGMGVDEAISLAQNEMARTLAVIASRPGGEAP